MGSQNDQLITVFNNWDKNRSGSIDVNELANAVRELGENITDEDAYMMVQMFDKDQSGTIDLQGILYPLLSNLVYRIFCLVRLHQ
jgi:Ca2+-binding EF-hand superfamily protein